MAEKMVGRVPEGERSIIFQGSVEGGRTSSRDFHTVRCGQRPTDPKERKKEELQITPISECKRFRVARVFAAVTLVVVHWLLKKLGDPNRMQDIV